MSSGAFNEWSTIRRQQLDNLVAARRATTGSGLGRRALTNELDHALILRLAGEFQGFGRDLHDESVGAIRGARLAGDPALDKIVGVLMENGRKLDSGNATWSNIANDFSRLGCNVAAETRSRYPDRYTDWVENLERLNRARNALAHQNREQIIECERLEPLTFITFRRWRSTISKLAAGLDVVVAAYLTQLNGARPW